MNNYALTNRENENNRNTNININRNNESNTNTNRETSYFFKSPEMKNQNQQGLSFVGLKSTRTYGVDMISPTYRSPNKEFTSTLRQGNKSSSKIRLRSANSLSINSGITNNNQDNYDLKFNSNLKTNQSREKSKIMSSYGDNSKFKLKKIK
jgi:hypothetical protein